MPTSDADRRDGFGRRGEDDLALAVARIEAVLQNVAVDTQETKKTTAEGFTRLNGRLRRVEAWKEAQEAVAAAVATQQAAVAMAQRDHRSTMRQWLITVALGSATVIGALLGVLLTTH